jgi:phosphopantetheine--protein transferase-like protein
MRTPAAAAESQRVQPLSVGVDIELIDNMPEAADFWAADFYRSHFTAEEIAYCVRQPHPRMHFAARWCAKEALMKCDPAFREVDPTTLQVTVAASGQPVFESLQSDGPRRLPHALSMTHTPQMAAAVVAAAAFPPHLTTT